VARGEWAVVGELAVQIKDSTSREGATRIYDLLLNERIKRHIKGRSNVLQFLARTLRSVDPSPEVIRRLTRQTVDFLQSGDHDAASSYLPLSWLLASCDRTLGVVDEELVSRIDAMVKSGHQETHMFGLRLASMLVFVLNTRNAGAPNLPESSKLVTHWGERSDEMIDRYKHAVIAAGREHIEIRYVALRKGFTTIGQMLRTPEDLRSLIYPPPMNIFGASWAGLLSNDFLVLALHSGDDTASASRERMVAAGQYLSNIGSPPWVQAPITPLYPGRDKGIAESCRFPTLDPISYLASAVVAFIEAETDDNWGRSMHEASPPGVFTEMYPYIECRYGSGSEPPLRELPVPNEFKQVFREWAEGKVNFIRPVPDSPGTVGQQSE
jgi:hypothetical protein